MINVEVQRENTENSLSLLRRFTKRVQGSGVLPRVRSIRYSSRHLSEIVKKKKTLKKIRARAYIQEQIKLGKLVETTRANGRKRR
jgi:ribosomal protein S21